jgi:hypothetical protein
MSANSASAPGDSRASGGRLGTREIFLEVARLLYNGLALDGLDEQDTRAVVVAGLCADLVSEDPGSAVRERAQAVLSEPGELHDPEAASAAYLVSAAMMKLRYRSTSHGAPTLTSWSARPRSPVPVRVTRGARRELPESAGQPFI